MREVTKHKMGMAFQIDYWVPEAKHREPLPEVGSEGFEAWT